MEYLLYVRLHCTMYTLSTCLTHLGKRSVFEPLGIDEVIASEARSSGRPRRNRRDLASAGFRPLSKLVRRSRLRFAGSTGLDLLQRVNDLVQVRVL